VDSQILEGSLGFFARELDPRLPLQIGSIPQRSLCALASHSSDHANTQRLGLLSRDSASFSG
jgi:hypothetical protein